jgi:hypothetical protein
MSDQHSRRALHPNVAHQPQLNLQGAYLLLLFDRSRDGRLPVVRVRDLACEMPEMLSRRDQLHSQGVERGIPSSAQVLSLTASFQEIAGEKSRQTPVPRVTNTAQSMPAG